MRPLRSFLFVPGHRPDWVDKAVASGADALILDLEDSVPEAEKANARQVSRSSIERLHAEGAPVSVFVRVGSWRSGVTGDDLEAVVVPGLAGVFVPKSETAEDLLRVDTLLTHFERRAGVEVGSSRLIVACERALALANARELAAAPRVMALVGGGAKGADLARDLGYRWTGTGMESLYLRSRVVLACRAERVAMPLASIWQDIADVDGLVGWATANRDLGFRGQVAIHPSHIEVIHRIYGPSPVEVEYWRALVEAYDEAEARGVAAIRFKGEHVDKAHADAARESLAWAESLLG